MKTPALDKLLAVARSAKLISTADGVNEVGSSLTRLADAAQIEINQLKVTKTAAKPKARKKAKSRK